MYIEKYEIKNKILEVWAAARVIVQRYGHTKKFAKHIVALVIKQMDGLMDVELVDLAGTKIGRIIGYEKRPDYSIFSKFRERARHENGVKAVISTNGRGHRKS